MSSPDATPWERPRRPTNADLKAVREESRRLLRASRAVIRQSQELRAKSDELKPSLDAMSKAEG